jgi:uncharacterized protein (TIGR02687 family)
MVVEKIQNIYRQENKKIIFYFDSDGTFWTELPEITSAGIKVVEVKQNYFELKYKLEFEWNNELVFLYHPFAKPTGNDLKRYPLLDLLKANYELLTDDASEFIADYRLKDHHLPMVKKYLKQLKLKTNQRKLARILEPSKFNDDSLKLGLISLTLDFHSVTDRNICMAKWLSVAMDEKMFAKTNSTLKELELDETLLKWFNLLLETTIQELALDTAKEFANKIKYNILSAYISKPDSDDTYKKLKLEHAANVNKLLAFFQDWSEHPTLQEQIEIVFSSLADEINSLNILKWYGPDQKYGYYPEEILRTIISELYAEVANNPLKNKDACIKWLRSPNLSEDNLKQIKFLYHVSGMYATLEAYHSFKFTSAEDFIKEYTNELYKVDFNYRKAVQAFESVRDHLYHFEDMAMEVFKFLNQKYDRFLVLLNVEWQKVLNESGFNLKKLKIEKQHEFYAKNLKDFEYKIVVIISDAFRYELGYELFNDLLADSKNNLTITPVLSSIPSYTNLGMSNLLPHQTMSVEKGEQDLIFKINEKPTVSTYRETILKMAEPDSSAIDYSQVMKFDRKEGRDYFKDNRIVYIYHDWVDAIGDKKRTEHETFEATSKAVEDLKRLISKLYGWNVYHVLVTADHGFLFNYNDLPETSREYVPKGKGYVQEHVRFVISDEFEGKVDGYQMEMKNTGNVDTNLTIAIPRAINRYRKQGNIGVQFVHGGASLQEMIIPVIKFYKQKKELLQTVTFKRLDQADKIASGSIKISLFQNEPVSNEFKSAEVMFGLYSDTGELYSNEVEIHFNSTSANPKERVFEIILSLNTLGSKAGFCYLKAFDKKDKSRLNPFDLKDMLKISSLTEKDEF